MNRMSRIIIAGIALVFVFCSQAGFAFVDSDLDKVLLGKDELPGYSLNNTQILGGTWPNIIKLPYYMESPENSPDYSSPTDQAFGRSNPLNEPPVLGLVRNDGYRQIWTSPSLSIVATIDYGIYDSSVEAQKALKYVVYERSMPIYNQSWYPPTLPQYNAYARPVYPNVRRINTGDLGYWIAFPTGGSSVYFTKGRYIFMVDSPKQSVEDRISEILALKASKL